MEELKYIQTDDKLSQHEELLQLLWLDICYDFKFQCRTCTVAIQVIRYYT